MKTLKNILALALVSMFVACGGNKNTQTDQKATTSTEKTATTSTEKTATTSTEKAEENSASKPIEAYKNIIAEVEKLGLKSSMVNLTSENKVLQLLFSNASNKVTSVTVQINYCKTPYFCAAAIGLKEFTNIYGDKGAARSEKSGIYDSKIKEEKMGEKTVFVNLSHYKQKPSYNSYRANYMEGKYMVEVYIAGKYNVMTDDYQIEQELGKAILEATLKIKPE